MSKQQCRWLPVGACLLLANCGTSNPSGSERVAQRQASVALPAQVSADFAVDDSKPTIDLGATLLNVTGSTGGGYLLTYGVNHSAEGWSRSELAFVNGIPAIPLYELVFVQWDAESAAPKTLARLRGAPVQSALAVDVDSGWLVVYQVTTDSGSERHAVVLSRDGSLTSPTDLPVPCSQNLSGLTRGGSSVLVTDVCGAGALLDLSGHFSSSFSITAPPSTSALSAFNGVDFLAAYGVPDVSTRAVAYAVPITPTGGLGTPTVLALPRVADGSVFPLGVVANGSSFLTLLSQSRGAVGGFDLSYRIATEAADHTFTFGAERYLPGGPNSSSSAPTDLGGAALALNGHFVIVRTRSTGQTELIYPSSDPGFADASQPLTLGPPFSAGSFVSTDSQGSNGTRLLFTNGAQGARLNASFQAIDAAPVELMNALRQQYMPSFAFAGQHYFAAWAEGGFDDSGAITKIFGRRMSASGALLDSASVQLSSGLHRNTDPLVVGNPSFFATLTNDYYAEGALLTNVEPPMLSTASASPLSSPDGIAVATDGASLTAAFYDHDGYSLKLRKLDDTGTWTAAVRLTGSFVSSNIRIAVVFNGGQYVVLWTNAGDPGQRVVYGVRASSDFALLDDPPKELLRFNCPDNPNVPGRTYDSGLQLIASGDHLLFSWSDINDRVDGLHIARLSSNLDLLDAGGVLVATQPFEQTLVSTRRAALGWDGSNDWVVWRDNEAGARPGLASLRGRRFSDTLNPVDADSLLISNDLDELSKVTLAVGDEGRSLVGYTRSSSDYTYRVRARFLSSAPFPDAVPCNDASQCQNGLCSAGLCSSVAGTGGSGVGGSNSIGGAAGTSGSIGGASGGSDSSGGASGGSDSSGGALSGSGAVGGDAAGGAAYGASAGRVGVAGSTTSGGGGSKNHGCSIRGGAVDSSRASSLASLAGLLSTLSWLRRRGRRRATAPPQS